MLLLASILGCDLGRVNEEIARVERYVDGLHFDIADGHFVPEVTFGEPLLRSLKTKLPVDVHLMVANPKRHIESVIASLNEAEGKLQHAEDKKTRFPESRSGQALGEAPRSGEGVQTPSGLTTSHLPKGRMTTHPFPSEEGLFHSPSSHLSSISFHIESCFAKASQDRSDEDPLENIRLIQSAGMQAGVAIKAETSVKALEPVITEADYIVLMTIVSGFAGNPFLREPLAKISWIRQRNPKVWIVVDGGVNAETIVDVRAAGVDGVVSGSYLFRSANVVEAVRILRGG